MKYGEALREQSAKQWYYNNIDYNDLKHLIKVNTTRDQGQAMNIPGHDDIALEKFEEHFYNELYLQHKRIDDFVKDKANVIGRRLQDYHNKLASLILKGHRRNSAKGQEKQRIRFSRLERELVKCGEDLTDLQRFVAGNGTGFYKLLKKYKVC